MGCSNYSRILNYIDKLYGENLWSMIKVLSHNLGCYKCDKSVASIVKVQKNDIYATKKIQAWLNPKIRETTA
jgi:hypothetical protein